MRCASVSSPPTFHRPSCTGCSATEGYGYVGRSNGPLCEPCGPAVCASPSPSRSRTIWKWDQTNRAISAPSTGPSRGGRARSGRPRGAVRGGVEGVGEGEGVGGGYGDGLDGEVEHAFELNAAVALGVDDLQPVAE